MKLAAIVNLWDGEELLPLTLKRMIGEVDLVIIVYQVISNFGEPHSPIDTLDLSGVGLDVVFHKYMPNVGRGPSSGMDNETAKRNLGIQIARDHECTHFFHLDCDEFYSNFGLAKREYIRSGAEGSVCGIYTYFGKPTYRLKEPDGYFVPFIHKLYPETECIFNAQYPFYVDPTRRPNVKNVVKIDEMMHHFSWVRKDIERKARNSSAAPFGNQLKGLLDDYHQVMNSKDVRGYRIKDMGNQELIEVPDRFGLSGLFVGLSKA